MACEPASSPGSPARSLTTSSSFRRSTLYHPDPQNVITVVVLILVAVVSSHSLRASRHRLILPGEAQRRTAPGGIRAQSYGIIDRDELGRVLAVEAARLLEVEAIFVLPGPEGPRVTRVRRPMLRST